MKQRKNFLTAALAVFSLIAACIVCDGIYGLDSSVYELTFESLPPETDGLRIVQLSDLHGSRFGKRNEKLAALVIAQQPDIIALTGDMAGSKEDLAALEVLLDQICRDVPVYYVSGNHEWAGGCMSDVRAMMEDFGVRSLANKYELVKYRGGKIIIAGVDDPNGRADMPKPDKFISQLRDRFPGEFVLLLAHRNYWIQKYPDLQVQLILCGHAHGGIIRLPLIGGVLGTDHSFKAEYEAGLYSSGSYIMEVSRGLGNSIAVPRIFNRPEVVTIVLHSKAS